MYDYVEEFLAIRKRVFDLSTRIDLGEQSAERVASFCLHGRIIDLASSVLALFQSRDVAGIPHLVRGQLEAFADLRNLSAIPNYVRNMEAAYFNGFARVLRGIVRESIDQKGISDVSETLKLAEGKLAQLKNQGANVLNIFDRFSKAELTSEYYSVYSYLCTHAHNNISALEARHIDKSKKPYQLLILLDDIDVELSLIIDLSLKIPIMSLGILMEGTEGDLVEEYEQLFADFEEARRGWLPSQAGALNPPGQT